MLKLIIYHHLYLFLFKEIPLFNIMLYLYVIIYYLDKTYMIINCYFYNLLINKSPICNIIDYCLNLTNQLKNLLLT